MQQQLADVFVQCRGQAGKHVGQPRMRPVAVCFGRCQRTHDRSGASARRFAAGEQPVLPPQGDPQGDGPDGVLFGTSMCLTPSGLTRNIVPDDVFDGVVVDRVAAIVHIASQCRFAFEAVVDRVGHTAVAHDGRSQFDQLWVYLLADNLIRRMMAQAAQSAHVSPRCLSFKHTLQLWIVWHQQGIDPDDNENVILLMALIAQQRVEQTLRDAINAIRHHGVSKQALDRAKGRARGNLLTSRDGPVAVALQLNEAIAAGDWTAYATMADRLAAVTTADVQRVAREYLIDAQLTVGYLTQPTKSGAMP
jgi:hypothetical protein